MGKFAQAFRSTDGNNLFYNKDWVQQLTDAQLLGVVVHEAMHVAFKKEPKLRFNSALAVRLETYLIQRISGVVHPAIWARAKRGDQDALLWIREDLEELSLVGGFLGGVYRRAARRLRRLGR